MANNDLAQQLRDILDSYSQVVQDATKEAVDEVAKEVQAEIKPLGGYLDRTGRYRKGFYTREEREGLIYRRRLANRQYQITHLLENGHATRDGTGRTRAFEHWEEADDYVAEHLPEAIAKKIQDAGG